MLISLPNKSSVADANFYKNCWGHFLSSANVNKIKLTTIMTEEAYDALMHNGSLSGDRRKGEMCLFPGFKAAYDWMASQMELRLGRRPYWARDPLWAWYRLEGKNAPLDLRALKNSSNSRCDVFYRVDFIAPVDAVLLSSFEKWHIPLNEVGKSRKKDVDNYLDDKWQDIFRLGKKTKSIQACLWEIRSSWVTRATRHSNS